MNQISALLKKNNCIWVKIEIGGSLTIRIVGDYDGDFECKGNIPLSEIVYIDDFPALMNAFNDFSTSSERRLYTHFRMELGSELHWAYLCCEKGDSDSCYMGMLLDVYEYLDCIPNDSVIGAFESRQKLKISELNKNAATLEEICGKDYLTRIQQVFGKTGADSAIFDDQGRFICSYTTLKDEFFDNSYTFVYKLPIRFNYKVGGWWYIGTDDEDSAELAQSILETLTENLSRVAHSSILLYNEAENSRAVNRQLGANVEQQMLINSIYSVIMEEPDVDKALNSVLEITSRSLNIDRIAAYLSDGDGNYCSVCDYRTEAGQNSLLDSCISEYYERICAELSTAENYFSRGVEPNDSGLSAYAVSKISGSDNGIGLLFYEVFGNERHWEYNDRKIMRSISQIISDLLLRREMNHEIDEKNRQLTRLAFYDSMLGIKNRAKLDIDASEAIAAHCSGVAMAIQIVNTHSLNEVFGQSYTDNLLRFIAEYLSLPEIGGDCVYRYSGSIMFLFLKEKTPEDARELAKNIIKRFSEPFIIDGVEQFAEAAIGMAVFDSSTVQSEDVYRAAVLSLYRANEYGKNSLAFFSREIRNTAGTAYRLEQELRRCIADHMRNFRLTFQPVFSSEGIHHYETLLRWHSEKEGTISPRVFIKLMEKVGLDSAIDFWVLPEACRFCKKIRERTGTDVRVSVNLTTHEMKGGAVVGAVHRTLAETGLPPDALIVEVPESAHIFALNETAATLGKLKKMGVSICIDSFGSEYMPMHVLKYSYVDMIKISSSLLTNSVGSFDYELIDTVVRLAESRNIETIAKNVEYLAHMKGAREYGITLFQGGLFSPPRTQEELILDPPNAEDLPAFSREKAIQ